MGEFWGMLQEHGSHGALGVLASRGWERRLSLPKATPQHRLAVARASGGGGT